MALKDPPDSAARFLPDRLTLPALRRAAAGCTGCPLHRLGTQTVFGEGPADAALMLIGEQPGDREDIEGRPFVGPAGLLLDDKHQKPSALFLSVTKDQHFFFCFLFFLCQNDLSNSIYFQP